MNLQFIERCPVNGKPGARKYGSVEDWFFSTPGTWSYFCEPGTGHLWLNPRPAREEVARLYAEYYTHVPVGEMTGSLWEQAVTHVLLRKYGYPITTKACWRARMLSWFPTVADAAAMEVAKLPPRRGRQLLDFGCGSGHFMLRMAQGGWEVHGVEPDPKAAEALRSKYRMPIRTSLADAEDWVERFDVIVLNHVIEHLDDPIVVLRDLSTMLAPGGEILIATPNPESLGCRIFRRYWRGLEAPRHFNLFTCASLNQALERAGLIPKEMSTEVRLARGLFFSSVLASRKRFRIELEPTHEPLVKLAGYAFQLLETTLKIIFPYLGEEIYCRAVARKQC